MSTDVARFILVNQLLVDGIKEPQENFPLDTRSIMWMIDEIFHPFGVPDMPKTTGNKQYGFFDQRSVCRYCAPLTPVSLPRTNGKTYIRLGHLRNHRNEPIRLFSYIGIGGRPHWEATHERGTRLMQSPSKPEEWFREAPPEIRLQPYKNRKRGGVPRGRKVPNTSNGYRTVFPLDYPSHPTKSIVLITTSFNWGGPGVGAAPPRLVCPECGEEYSVLEFLNWGGMRTKP